MATITALGFSIFSTYDGGGVADARRDISRLSDDVEQSGRVFSVSVRSMGLFTEGMILLSPAIAPIGAVLTGIGVAATGMGASAGIAGGVFGVAMAGAISQTLKLAEAHKPLDEAQSRFITAIGGVKAAWQQFIDATHVDTLRIASIILDGIAAGIGKLKPLVDAVSPVVQKIAEDFKRWAEGDGLNRLVNYIREFGVPALERLLEAGRIVIGVLGEGFRTVLPHTVSVADAIKRGAESLERWVSGGGFERFISLPIVGFFVNESD
ncbi:hypothetical protein [Streptomyces sp. NPDC055085]